MKEMRELPVPSTRPLLTNSRQFSPSHIIGAHATVQDEDDDYQNNKCDDCSNSD